MKRSMYNLSMISEKEIKLLEKISAEDVIKALTLFCVRNRDVTIDLYEISSFADDEGDYFRILHLFK